MADKKTRIMAVGDIHGDSGLVRRLAKKAQDENVDIVILAGDLTFADQPAKDIIKPFLKVHKKVLIIPGNHEPNETTDMMAQFYTDTINLHNSAYRKGNVGIFGAGTVEDSDEPLKSSEIFKSLAQGFEQIKDLEKKIMVTHMHPHGSQSEFSGFKGSKAIKEAVRKFKPDLLITSHIHEAGGLQEHFDNTLVVNVSRSPAIFDI